MRVVLKEKSGSTRTAIVPAVWVDVEHDCVWYPPNKYMEAACARELEEPDRNRWKSYRLMKLKTHSPVTEEEANDYETTCNEEEGEVGEDDEGCDNLEEQEDVEDEEGESDCEESSEEKGLEGGGRDDSFDDVLSPQDQRDILSTGLIRFGDCGEEFGSQNITKYRKMDQQKSKTDVSYYKSTSTASGKGKKPIHLKAAAARKTLGGKAPRSFQHLQGVQRNAGIIVLTQIVPKCSVVQLLM
jgi:hypothetical protein